MERKSEERRLRQFFRSWSQQPIPETLRERLRADVEARFPPLPAAPCAPWLRAVLAGVRWDRAENRGRETPKNREQKNPPGKPGMGFSRKAWGLGIGVGAMMLIGWLVGSMKGPRSESPAGPRGDMALPNSSSEAPVAERMEVSRPPSRVPGREPEVSVAASRMGVPLTDLVFNSDLIVTGTIRRVVRDDTQENQAWGTLQVEQIFQGPRETKEVRLGFPAVARTSMDLLYRPGDDGVWLLQRDSEEDFYFTNYPDRRLPREFVPMIQGILQDVPVETAWEWLQGRSKKVRREVLELLEDRPYGETERDRVVENLAYLLEQERDPGMCRQWMGTLRTLGGEKAVSVLQELLHHEVTGKLPQQLGFQLAVLEHLGKLGDRSIMPELLRWARDEKLGERMRDHRLANGLRRRAIKTLAQLGDRSLVPYFMELLESEESSERRLALRALGEWEAVEAIPALIDFMEGQERSLRQQTANLLKELTFQDFSVSMGEGKISSAPNEDPEIWRGWWTEHQDQTRVDWVTKAIRSGETHLIWKLGQGGDPQAVPVLMEQLTDTRMPQAAAEALGELGDVTTLPALRQAVPVLMEQLAENPDPSVRSAAAEALGELGDVAALPALRQAGQDPDWGVRVQAMGAVCRLGDEEGRAGLRQAVLPPYLEDLPDAPDRVFRRPPSWLRLLSEVEGPQAIPILVQVLASRDRRMVVPAIRELARLTDQSFGGLGWRATEENLHRVITQWQNWWETQGSG